nr:helix-turn-helix domain-containing protein [Thioclava sp. JE_KL1]
MTGTEAKLLELFLSRPEQVLSRDDINRVLHGRDWSPYDRTIDTHIARLRRKIEPADDANRMIRSVRGVGYVFTGQITGEVPPA